MSRKGTVSDSSAGGNTFALGTRKPLQAALIFVAVSAPKSFATDTQLLSLGGIHLIPLKTGQSSKANYISSFQIKTWAVQVLAVCHIPRGWTISAGKNANPEGILAGSAGEGVAFIDAGRSAELNKLFLVRITDYHAADEGDCTKNCTPATFAGNFFIGTYGAPEDPETKLRLKPEDIRLTPAAKCPDPS